jgi:hypothetical protein
MMPVLSVDAPLDIQTHLCPAGDQLLLNLLLCPLSHLELFIQLAAGGRKQGGTSVQVASDNIL